MDKGQRSALNAAFTIAVAKDYQDVIPTLLRAGANIHYNDDAALMLAAEAGRTGLVEYLLTMGADSHGDNAMLRAAKHGHSDTVKFLVKWADDHTKPIWRGPKPA